MDIAQWQRVKTILDEVLAAPSLPRPAELRRICDDDSTLMAEVRSFLDHRGDLEGFIERPLWSPHSDFRESLDPQGQRVGHYRLKRLIGRGGMGQVYLAHREDDFDQQVALKVISSDEGRQHIFDRFRRERQILAELDHPNIAHLLDGGSTDDGRPYFVMEYVEGERIDDYCDQHRLGIRQRLELFLKVCAAVQAAHRNLVVHRDLKPGNILVTPDGEPKLLDFGIAKVLQPENLSKYMTPTVQRPMTPRFASPEQILDAPITTASDIYGLGVLLYVLLTGHSPYRLGDTGYAHLIRMIVSEEPKKPSDKVLDTEDDRIEGGLEIHITPAAVAAARGVEIGQLRRRLTGDLDAVVTKAMRKIPHERYESAERLAADLRCYLDVKPVHAREGNVLYRAGKLARRNIWGVVAAALVLGASVHSTVQWRRAELAGARAESQRIKAERERARGEKVLDFVKTLFQATNPDSAQGRTVTIHEALDQGRTKVIEGLLDDDPDLEAELAGTLGDVYRNLGLYPEARELLERAVTIRSSIYSEDNLSLAIDINDLASLEYYLGNYEKAEVAFRETLAMRQRLGQEEAKIARVMNNLASALKQQGKLEEAGQIYREVLNIRERIHEPGDERVARSLYSLGSLYYARGDFTHAVAPLRRALAIFEEALGHSHTQVATVLNSLGRVLLASGELEEAEARLRVALAIRIELLGDGHHHVALTRRDLAELYLARGELEEAGRLLQDLLPVLRRARGEDDWQVADAEGLFGAYLTATGRFAEAEPYVLRGYSVVKKAKGESSYYTARAHGRIVDLYESWGRKDEAAAYKAAAASGS